MENQELNLWLLKRIQTESSLRSEERRLDSVKREYNTERNKYQSAKENFQSTKLRLLEDKNPDMNPALKFEKVRANGRKFQADKVKFEEFSDRLNMVESKLKKQSVLVLHSKKKLEVLEEKINALRGRKLAKRNFREELEVLDGKIQQMVITNAKLNKEFKKDIKDAESIKDEDKIEKTELEINQDPDIAHQSTDTLNFNQELSAGSFTSSERGKPEYQQQDFNNTGKQEYKRDNSEFYEQIKNLSYLNDGSSDQVNLRFYNKSGHAFELEIRKDLNAGFIVEIRPHSKLDTLSLNSGKYEIIRNLKEQGLKLNKITILDWSNAAQ